MIATILATEWGYCGAWPEASTAVPKSPYLIPVSMEEIVQTLILPHCRAMNRAVISRHVTLHIGFHSRPFHVGFSVDKVERGEILLQEGRCPPITIFHLFHTHISFI